MPTVIEKYRVNAAALNVRSEPSTTAKVLSFVTRDQVIEKLAETPDGFWIKHKESTIEGWSAKKFLLKIIDVPAGTVFPWVAIATAEVGVTEFPGAGSNPRVLEYLSTVTNISEHWKSTDETAWCAAFVNWCVKKAGYVGTNTAVSTDWLDWGQRIEKPASGCLAVFAREGGGGHVGFYVDETVTPAETFIRLLGGNQDSPDTGIGQVNLKFYKKSLLLGYRIPK
jgi:uncharacterized protein (TIGR02594 family)